jgi:hypothetical protein
MSGCRLWIDVDEPQCKNDGACVALLGDGATCDSDGVCEAGSESGAISQASSSLPGRWSCVSNRAPAVALDPDKKLRVRMDVVDVTTLRVPPGLKAAACMANDIDCARPVVRSVAPGGDGFMEFELPFGFQGFFTLDAPDYVPALAYSNRPYTESTTTRGPPVITLGALDTLAANSGMQSVAADRGLIFLEIRDCDDVAADGVTFKGPGDETPFYFEGSLPNPDLDVTAISNQLSAGREPRAVGGFSNVEPGSNKMFQAILPNSGEVVSRVTVQIVAAHITYVRMRAGY